MNNLKVGWALVNTPDGKISCNIRKVGKKSSVVEIPRLNPTSALSIDHFDTYDVPNDCLYELKSTKRK